MRTLTLLSERRAADRIEMAEQLTAVVLRNGGTIAADVEWRRHHPHAIMLRITGPSGTTIAVDFDGKSPQPNTFVQTWNIDRDVYRSGRALRDEDGRPTHKINRVARGIGQLLTTIGADLRAFRAGFGFYTLDDAFRAWIDGLAYLDNSGDYRLRDEPRGKSIRVAPWNRYARELYPDNADFHRAAHAWADDVASQKHLGTMLDGAADETERDLILRDACQ